MQIFNTKKSREEWERKIEESYQKGRKDAEDEFLSKKSEIKIDEKDYKKMNEKDILTEIIKSINNQNKRIENLNSKISYVMDYKMIFKEANKLTNEIYDQEKLLSENISKTQTQISNFKSDVANIKSYVQDIEEELALISGIKSELFNITSEIALLVPEIEQGCSKIDDIAKNMNETILKYEDSPVEIINKIDKKIGITDDDMEYKNLSSRIEELEEQLYNISNDLTREFDDNEFDSISNKINGIEQKINNALDEYGFSSLYSKIDDLESKINSLEYKIKYNQQ